MSPEEKIEAAQKLIDEARAEIAAKKVRAEKKAAVTVGWRVSMRVAHSVDLLAECLVAALAGPTAVDSASKMADWSAAQWAKLMVAPSAEQSAAPMVAEWADSRVGDLASQRE